MAARWKIAPCTSCTQCKDEDGSRRCRINAALGSDKPYEIKPAEGKKKGVVMMSGVKPVAVTKKGLKIFTKQGYNQIVEADSIVTALPLELNRELLRAFEGKAPEVHVIGDCDSPALIVDGVAQGWRVSNAV